MLPNFVAHRHKCARYSLSKILAPWKSGPKFTKIALDVLHTNAPHCANFVAFSQMMYDKSVTKNLLHPSVFWSLRGTPWAEVHQSRHYRAARPGLSTCQILSLSDNLSSVQDICCQSMLISLKAWLTKSSKRRVSGPCGDKRKLKTKTDITQKKQSVW